MKRDVQQAVLTEIIEEYGLSIKKYKAEPYGNGHINNTFFVSPHEANDKSLRYIMQRINTTVFKNPVMLMGNIAGVTEFLRREILQSKQYSRTT